MDKYRSKRKTRSRGNICDFFEGDATTELLKPDDTLRAALSSRGSPRDTTAIQRRPASSRTTGVGGLTLPKQQRPQTASLFGQKQSSTSTLPHETSISKDVAVGRSTAILLDNSERTRGQLRRFTSTRFTSRNFDWGSSKVDEKAIRNDCKRQFEANWLNAEIAVNAMSRSAMYRLSDNYSTDFCYDGDEPDESFEPKFNIFQDYDRVRKQHQERLARDEEERRKYFEGKPLPKEIAPTEDYRNCYNKLMNDIVRTQVRRIGTIREKQASAAVAATNGTGAGSRPGSPSKYSSRKESVVNSGTARTAISGFGRPGSGTLKEKEEDVYDNLVAEYEDDYERVPDYSQFSPRSALLRETARRKVIPFAIREILLSTASLHTDKTVIHAADSGKEKLTGALRAAVDAQIFVGELERLEKGLGKLQISGADTPTMEEDTVKHLIAHTNAHTRAQTYAEDGDDASEEKKVEAAESDGATNASTGAGIRKGGGGGEKGTVFFGSQDSLANNALKAIDLNKDVGHAMTKDTLKTFLKQSVQVANHQLVSINVNNRGLGDERACCLAAALSACPNLTCLGVAGNRLTDISINPLLKAVFALSRIAFLDLSDNKLDSDSISAFKILEDRSCRLHELVLSKSDIDDSECAKLMSFLCNNRTLRTLDLSHNVIGGKEDYNTVFPDFITGGEAIATMLTQNRTLTSLDLSWNNLRSATAMTFVQSIEENSTLKSLNLAYNCIGDSAAQHLAHRLRTNVSLTSLNVSHNNIHGRGILVFSNALEHNEHLLEVNLNGNTIGLQGARSLLRTMRVRSSEGGHLRIYFRDSNMQYVNASEQLFDSCAVASKKYTLNMEDPYDYAVANYLLENANAEPLARLENIRWQMHHGKSTSKKPPPPVKVTLKRAVPATTIQFADEAATYSSKPLPTKGAATGGVADGAAGASRTKPLTVVSWVDHVKNINAAIDFCVKYHNEFDKMLADNKKKAVKIGLKGETMEAARHAARTAIFALADSMGLCPMESFTERVRIALQNSSPDKRRKIDQIFKIMFKVAFRMLDRDGAGSIGLEGMITCVSLLGMNLVPMYNPNLKKELKMVQPRQSPLKGGVLHRHSSSASFTFDDPPTVTGPYNDHEEVLNLADRLLAQMDPGNKGKVTEDEFVNAFFLSMLDNTPPSAGVLLNPETNLPWVLPTEGTLEFDYYSTKMPPTAESIHSDEGVLRYTDIVFETTSSALIGEGRLETIQAAVGEDMYLTASQANIMLDRLDEKHHHKVKGSTHLSVLEFLVPQLANPAEACRFLTQNCTFQQIVTLRRKMGPAFRAISGNACGHYILDLSRPGDRVAARKLADLNAIDKNRDATLRPQRDTSQAGDWENFRNESYNGKYKRLSSDWIQTALPATGKLRFDFVTTARPAYGVQPCTSEAFEKLVRRIFRKFGDTKKKRKKSAPPASGRSRTSVATAQTSNSRATTATASFFPKWSPPKDVKAALSGRKSGDSGSSSSSTDNDSSRDDGTVSDWDSAFSDDDLHSIVSTASGVASAAAPRTIRESKSGKKKGHEGHDIKHAPSLVKSTSTGKPPNKKKGPSMKAIIASMSANASATATPASATTPLEGGSVSGSASPTPQRSRANSAASQALNSVASGASQAGGKKGGGAISAPAIGKDASSRAQRALQLHDPTDSTASSVAGSSYYDDDADLISGLPAVNSPKGPTFNMGIAQDGTPQSNFVPGNFSAALRMSSEWEVQRMRKESGDNAVQAMLVEPTTKKQSSSPIDEAVFSMGPLPGLSKPDFMPADFRSALRLASERDLNGASNKASPSAASPESSRSRTQTATESQSRDVAAQRSMDKNRGKDEIEVNAVPRRGSIGVAPNNAGQPRRSSLKGANVSMEGHLSQSDAPPRRVSIELSNDQQHKNMFAQYRDHQRASAELQARKDSLKESAERALSAAATAAHAPGLSSSVSRDAGASAGGGGGVGQRFLRRLSNQRRRSSVSIKAEVFDERITPGSARELWLDTCETSWDAYKQARTERLFHALKAAIDETYMEPAYTNADTLTILQTAYKSKIFKDVQNLPVYTEELEYRKKFIQAYGSKTDAPKKLPSSGEGLMGLTLASKSKAKGVGLGVGGSRLEMINRSNRVMRRAIAGLRCQPNSFGRYASEVGSVVMRALGIDEIDGEEFEDGLINKRFSPDPTPLGSSRGPSKSDSHAGGGGFRAVANLVKAIHGIGHTSSNAAAAATDKGGHLAASGGDNDKIPLASISGEDMPTLRPSTGNNIGSRPGSAVGAPRRGSLSGNRPGTSHGTHSGTNSRGSIASNSSEVMKALGFGGGGVSYWNGPTPLLLNHCQRFERPLILLEVFLVYETWLSVAQVISLLREFNERCAPDEVLVRVVCIVFNRIIDLENFGNLMSELPNQVRVEINHRLGMLNTLVPLKPDGYYEFDLAAHDQREAAKVLIRMAVVESRENFAAESYTPSLVQPLIPHWQLPFRWTLPDNPRQGDGPKFCGYMSLTWSSLEKDGRGFAVLAARKELTIVRTLAGSRGVFARPFVAPAGMIRDYAGLAQHAARRMSLRSNALIKRSQSGIRLISRALSRRLTVEVDEAEEQIKSARSRSPSMSPLKIRSLSRSASIRALRVRREVSFKFIGSEDVLDPREKEEEDLEKLKEQLQTNLLKSVGGKTAKAAAEGGSNSVPDQNTEKGAKGKDKGQRNDGNGRQGREKGESKHLPLDSRKRSDASNASLSGYESAFSDDSWIPPKKTPQQAAGYELAREEDDFRTTAEEQQEEDSRTKNRRSYLAGFSEKKKKIILLKEDELEPTAPEIDDFASYDVSDFKYSAKVEKFQRAPWIGPKA